ncbi:MAG: M23 family metallopeptidase [Rikenellaceae bacterium]
MLRKVTTLLFALSISFSLSAQDGEKEIFRSPLEIPLALSANFGEIRTTHFHSGVDFKTQGVIGHRVVSVADGYISRISVSPTGYGNAIYISHPKSGKMSVYGHLESFRSDIAKYVKEYQYRTKRFSQNIYPSSELFPVKTGDFFALSGNTGSSGGPHLHFELRDLATQNTLSPLKVGGYAGKIEDTIPPKISSVTVVEIDESYGIPIHKKEKKYSVQSSGEGKYRVVGDTITIKRDSYLAFEVTEVKNNSTNIFGVTAMDFREEGAAPFWGYNIKEISFDYGRAINSFVLYPETTKSRNDFLRTYIAPENWLKIYTARTDNGVLYRDKLLSPKKMVLTATDEAENSSVLSFVVCVDTTAQEKMEPPTGELVFAGKYHTFKNDDCKVEFSPRTLQQSAYLDIESVKDDRFEHSKLIKIAEGEPPFNASAKLSIKPTIDEGTDVNKLTLCYVASSGKLTSLSSKYSGGYITASITGCGDYVLSIDNEKPTITPLFNTSTPPVKELRFKVSDNLSGIDSYNGYIDGNWVLFEYDAKSGIMRHKLDSGAAKSGVKRTLEFIVTDGCGNKNSFKTTF